MDSYLKVAETVLRSTRRPMSARAILEVAYKAGVVPFHLYGKTQQKTLQARLSEDILHRRDSSPFFRTEPGYFFLVELLDDPEVPAKWKARFPARRRSRDLRRNNTLSVKRSFAKSFQARKTNFQQFFETADTEGALAYLQPEQISKGNYCATWTFSMVHRKENVLAYRIGSYRDDRDAFLNKKSIGFAGALSFDDMTLFSNESFGVEECAMSVLVHDLDLSHSIFAEQTACYPDINDIMLVEVGDGNLDVVVLLVWQCPDWFEPHLNRLSLNEPHWLPVSVRYNDLDDFEPWSAQIVAEWSEGRE